MKTTLQFLKRRLPILAIFLSFYSLAVSQNDVMMQAFYWNADSYVAGQDGTWWDSLRIKMPALKAAGYTGLWVPPPSKGNFGSIDMGYGIFDHYDLGNYNQCGTTETRFGSRSELQSMISEAHKTCNGQYMDIYADIILNHIYASDYGQWENNPAVKCYMRAEAFTNGTQHVGFPTNEIEWVLNAPGAGDYYIQISGFQLPSDKVERGYDLVLEYPGSTVPAEPWSSGNYQWEAEGNNGGGNFNSHTTGKVIRGHIFGNGDIDEYKITLSGAATVKLKLIARRELVPFDWVWADQNRGYYPKSIWYNGSNLATTSALQAQTQTKIEYVNHTGTGEPNHSWNYNHFHPSDCSDYMGDGGFEDAIVTNTKWFGHDYNTFNTTVQNRLIDWGQWMSNEIDFDGYRLDFVRGFQEELVAKWVNNLPRNGSAQPFIVGEYFTGYKYRLHDWVNNVHDNYTHNGNRADVDAFDFPLKNDLTQMANQNGSNWNMTWLNNAGMVRETASGSSLPGTAVVTFVENHDTGKESDKWLWRDWDMAYAYILFAEGRPCVFYTQYYGVTQIDNHDNSVTVTPNKSLKTYIDKLIHARRTYMGGTMDVLTDGGNPVGVGGSPSNNGSTANVFIGRRQGNGSKTGAILVLNNHETTTKGMWVDNTKNSGTYTDWKNKTLVNVLNPSQTTTVQSDGRVLVWAPARGAAIWVPQNEYVAFSLMSASGCSAIGDDVEFINDASTKGNPAGLRAYPNPTDNQAYVVFTTATESHVNVQITDMTGRTIEVLADQSMLAGTHELNWDGSKAEPGVYLCVVRAEGKTSTERILLVK
ncbi:MAG: T9SS type A sorting domain-containing protein [Cyclobacteriaceae bacterium]